MHLSPMHRKLPSAATDFQTGFRQILTFASITSYQRRSFGLGCPSFYLTSRATFFDMGFSVIRHSACRASNKIRQSINQLSSQSGKSTVRSTPGGETQTQLLRFATRPLASLWSLSLGQEAVQLRIVKIL